MKQTAVEWLYDRFLFAGYAVNSEWKEQAKAMERELIKESCTMAIMQWHEWDKTNYLDLYDHKIEGAEIWSEDYVKELYGEIEIPEPNKIMELFNDYTSYCQYVKEEWNDGYINELFESGYIVEKEYTGEYECASRDIEYRMLTESEFNETFNSQPKMDELTQLRKLAGLLQSAWHHGNWKAETTNEREMEKIMTEQGYWPALPNPNQVRKDKLLTVSTSVKVNKQEILNQLHQHIKACSAASLSDAVMAFHEAIKLVEQLGEKQGPEVRWKPQQGEFILVRDHDSAEWKVLRFMQMARDGKGVVGQTPSGDKFTWAQYKRIDKAILDILYKTFNTKEK